MVDLWRINLIRIREAKGLTQKGLAEKSGVSQGQISQLESGKRDFTQKTLDKLLVALDTRHDQFFTNPDKKITAMIGYAENLSEFGKDEAVKNLHNKEQEETDTLFREFKKKRRSGEI